MTPTAAGDGVRFDSLQAVELADAREEVLEWADELLVDQVDTWNNRRKLQRERPELEVECKPAAPTRAECLAKSREIRRKRERDASYWNQLTASHPTR